MFSHFGTDRPEEVTSASFAGLVASTLLLNSMDEDEAAGVAILIDALSPHLADPAYCARLLSRQSLFDITLPNIKERSDFLKTAAWRLFDRFPDDSYSSHIVREFVDMASDVSWSVTFSQQDAYNAFFDNAGVKERHPLFLTDYCLYVPSHQPLAISDPIEQIILESAKDPSLILRMNSREFEQFLCKIFEAFGYDVELTAQTRDGGVDIICLQSKNQIPMKIAIEAKRYDPGNPISVGLVRQFVGANSQIRANKLVYVTTSRYTRDARGYAESPLNVGLLELKELPDIVQWANEFKDGRAT